MTKDTKLRLIFICAGILLIAFDNWVWNLTWFRNRGLLSGFYDLIRHMIERVIEDPIRSFPFLLGMPWMYLSLFGIIMLIIRNIHPIWGAGLISSAFILEIYVVGYLFIFNPS